MACERVDITVLVVDDDDTSLAIVANILSSWEYKVLTANSALNALETLREFEGFFDLVITELHISGMNGFEFQKRVKDEFQLPVIMMSEDNRKSVMAKSLENGAALYLLKPICADDIKDIWKYAMPARKGKLVIENELRSGEGESTGEKIIIQDVNSSATASVTHEPKRRRKYSKRKSTQMNKEDQSEGSSRALKKPKIVWTTYLHNLFLLAIKHIGLDKAVPKKILEIMNVPYLTRENVASHLQKYRIFLRKVAERGILEGLSDRALRSRFASGLIKDIQTRTEKLRVPVQQYLKSLTQQIGNKGTGNAPKPSNQGTIRLHEQEVWSTNNNNVTTQLGSGQFPNPMHRGLMLQNQQAFNGNSLNQVRLGQSSFGSNVGANNMQQKMLASYANKLYQANHSYNNAGSIFPSYGMGHGLMTSANGLKGGLKNGDEPMYLKHGSLGNHRFNYGLGNVNMASLSSSINLPWSSTCYSSSNSFGIQLNGGSQMVGTGIKEGFNSVGITAAIANNNSFGLNNGTQTANMHVANLGHGNTGLVQGRSLYASAAWDESATELPAALNTNATREENVSRIPQLPQQLDGIGNVAGNKHQYNASSISEGKASQLEDDLSELFFMLDDMHLLNETEENPHASGFLNSDFSSSCHVVQSIKQTQTAGDVIVPPTSKSSINQQNDSPTSSDKNPNQDWDMELIEALFGTEIN